MHPNTTGEKLKKIVPIVAAILLVILFLYTGISKLADYARFRKTIADASLLAPVAGFLAWAVPAGEIITAVLLLIRRSRLAGLYISFVMMLLFTGYIIWLLYFMEGVACGCGGVLEAMDWEQHLIFNIAFTLLALAGVITEYSRRKKKFRSQ
jgi:uncharacterized membrane protein YphA (DoxX/SURF4 family)